MREQAPADVRGMGSHQAGAHALVSCPVKWTPCSRLVSRRVGIHASVVSRAHARASSDDARVTGDAPVERALILVLCPVEREAMRKQALTMLERRSHRAGALVSCPVEREPMHEQAPPRVGDGRRTHRAGAHARASPDDARAMSGHPCSRLLSR